jgi:HlyD family secretion protein
LLQTKLLVREINETVSASGKIKPHVEVKISPEVSGEVVELPIKEGDVVKKGQLLCKIRPDILKSGYERAVASYNSQKASVGNSSQMQNKPRLLLPTRLQFIKEVKSFLTKRY